MNTNIQTNKPCPPGQKKKPHGCISSLLVFLFVISAMGLITMVNFKLTMLNPSFWKSWLVQSNAYNLTRTELLPNIFSPVKNLDNSEEDTSDLYLYDNLPEEDLYSQAEDIDSEGVLSSEDSDLLTNLLQENISEDWLQEQSENIITGWFAWVYGQEDDLRIVLDLSPLQKAFNEGIIQIVENQYYELPVCPSGYENSSQWEEMNCKVEGVDFDHLRERFVSENPEDIGFGYVPAELIIDEAVYTQLWRLPSGDQAGETDEASVHKSNIILSNPPLSFQIYNIWFYVFLVMTIVFSGLVVYLYRRDVAVMFKVLGMSLLVPAIIAFSLSLLLFLGSGFIAGHMSFFQPELLSVSQGGAPEVLEMPTIVSNFFFPVLGQLVKLVAYYSLFINGGVLLISITFLITSSLQKKRQVKNCYQ